MPKVADGQTRLHANLPDDLREDLVARSKKRHMSQVEFLRRCVRIGILVDSIQDDPDATLIIRRGSTEQQVVIV